MKRHHSICEREITVAGKTIKVDINNPIYRFPTNPILTAKEVNKAWTRSEWKVITVHNAGITKYNKEILMLFRSHLRSGISILGLATSTDGISHWKVTPTPALLPATTESTFASNTNIDTIIENEAGGLEDPRITKIEENYFITYSAYHPFKKNRVRIHLVVTKDFTTFTRYGEVSELDMRNVTIFPEKIKGRYFALFRPNDHSHGDTGGSFAQIKIGFAEHWQTNKWDLYQEPIFRTGGGPSSFQDKIGPGAPPFKTADGRWLNIFHGVRTTMDGNPYSLGVALHDSLHLTDIKVSDIPIVFPTKSDCKVSDDSYIHVPNVVFSCGAIRHNNGMVAIYYGGNDTVMNVCFTHEDILINLCENFGRDPLTGERMYKL